MKTMPVILPVNTMSIVKDMLVQAFGKNALELPLLVHPYDDRGMDIIGNPQRLYQLYQDFDAYVLEYDRQRMADMMRRIQQENP